MRSYPRFQVPREFRDYEDFCRVADELIAAAGVDDYTYIWWDVRPHPQLGTVEVRAVDVQMDAAGSSAIAALVQAIAARELADPSDTDLSREALEESYFQAASHGLDAEILLDSAAPEPAREVCRRMLDSVQPYARELGSEAALTEIERILREGNGADEQRRVHREAGMEGLLSHLGGAHAMNTTALIERGRGPIGALPPVGPLCDLVVAMLSAARGQRACRRCLRKRRRAWSRTTTARRR